MIVLNGKPSITTTSIPLSDIDSILIWLNKNGVSDKGKV